jgi:hypothetical protein
MLAARTTNDGEGHHPRVATDHLTWLAAGPGKYVCRPLSSSILSQGDGVSHVVVVRTPAASACVDARATGGWWSWPRSSERGGRDHVTTGDGDGDDQELRKSSPVPTTVEIRYVPAH